MKQWRSRPARALRRGADGGLTSGENAADAEIEDLALAMLSVLDPREAGMSAMPPWLRTTAEALRRHRVARAAGLLSRRGGLAEVALDAVADQSHMTRAFRQEYGITPARYRAAFG